MTRTTVPGDVRWRRFPLCLVAVAALWVFSAGADAAAHDVAPSADVGQLALQRSAVERSPDDDSGDSNGDTQEEPADEPADDEEADDEEADDEEADDEEPAPEPDNVPIFVWIGAAVVVLAAIVWTVSVARD